MAARTYSHGGPVDRALRNTNALAAAHLFKSGMKQSGRLVAWEYYAHKTGMFWADIWRPGPNGAFQLIHKTKIDVMTIGYNVRFYFVVLRVFLVRFCTPMKLHFHMV